MTGQATPSRCWARPPPRALPAAGDRDVAREGARERARRGVVARARARARAAVELLFDAAEDHTHDAAEDEGLRERPEGAGPVAGAARHVQALAQHRLGVVVYER